MDKKNAFLKELVKQARTYGWLGDYIEVRDFVRWCFEECGEKAPASGELKPFPDV